jgi:hypothetical protein
LKISSSTSVVLIAPLLLRERQFVRREAGVHRASPGACADERVDVERSRLARARRAAV